MARFRLTLYDRLTNKPLAGPAIIPDSDWMPAAVRIEGHRENIAHLKGIPLERVEARTEELPDRPTFTGSVTVPELFPS